MPGDSPASTNPILPLNDTPAADSDGGRAEMMDLELLAEQLIADPGLSQFTTRREEDGIDTLVGYFRCHLQGQQQRYALHVPLYPPMHREPMVQAMAMDSDQATVKVTDRQRFGIRVEIVLPRPVIESTDLLVEIIAHSDSD